MKTRQEKKLEFIVSDKIQASYLYHLHKREREEREKRRRAGKRLLSLMENIAAQGYAINSPLSREEVYADREL